MNKSRLLKWFCFLVIFTGALEISLSENTPEGNPHEITAGVSGKQVKEVTEVAKKGWKWMKGCKKAEPVEGIKPVKPIVLPVVPVVNQLTKDLEIIKSQEEILPKIEKFFNSTVKNENDVKVISCIRGESGQVRMQLQNIAKSEPSLDKVIRISSKSINLREYDIEAFHEQVSIGQNGEEYINFIIPKKPQFILNGRYPDRIYESMIFNVPKDVEGKYKRFRTYLLSFMYDLIKQPVQLWNEYKFRNGLKQLSLDERDVLEIQQYRFATIFDIENRYGNFEYIKEKVA